MKHILMLATGGTIACRQTGHGLAPSLTGEELLEFVPALSRICKAIVRNPMSVDSTDMSAEHRIKIAQIIWKERDTYDGFVITHGTDTLAYTSTLLYHMLPNFRKPVILTGAFHPMSEPDSDAGDNLLDAFRVACSDYQGVAACLRKKIIRGTNLVKFDTMSVDSFRSVNAPNDGLVTTTGGVIINHRPEPVGDGMERLVENVDSNVMLLKLIPDLDPSILDFLCRYHKVIIEAFGAGGVPTRLEKMLQKLILGGTKVYLTTQCPSGDADLHRYVVGRRAEALGAIGLGQRTTEDALAAVMCGEL